MPAVAIGLGSYFGFLVLFWLVVRFVWGKPIAPIWLYLGYSSFLLLFWPFVEMMRHPGWRRKWLERAGVKSGHVVLDEGFGMGTSSIQAARMVGRTGMVYALDNEPLHVAILWLRAKIRRLSNLRVILSDAKVTGLEDGTVDVVYVADAFHEFGDKLGTLKELHRVLKRGGSLAIWEEGDKKAVIKAVKLVIESGLFSLTEQGKGFWKLERSQMEADA